MAATTTFVLYKATVKPYEDDSYESLKEILDNPLDEYQPMARNGEVFGLEDKVRKTQGIYFGTFCLVQTRELPQKVKFGEEPEDLFDDDDDEVGLGHYTSFFYDSVNDMIGIQSNRNGISANGVAAFFRRNYNIHSILFELVINPADLARLDNLTQVHSFEVSIAKLQDAQAFGKNSKNASFKEFTTIADNTDANVFRLYFGIGYQRNDSLSKRNIRKYLQSIINNQGVSNVTKIEIRGREGDDDNIEVIDLINNKVKFIVTLPRSRYVDRVYTKSLVTKAISGYQTILPELNTYKIKAKGE
ncbi:MAG TPA: DUF6731 family protein [Puia sp.]|jgi:hypothetical protein